MANLDAVLDCGKRGDAPRAVEPPAGLDDFARALFDAIRHVCGSGTEQAAEEAEQIAQHFKYCMALNLAEYNNWRENLAAWTAGPPSQKKDGSLVDAVQALALGQPESK